jgi:DNA-binding NarL/FixJ family response regulator
MYHSYGKGQIIKDTVMKIFLADHHPQTLMALKAMLQEKPNLIITGEAMDANNLLAQVCKTSSDMVLMDSELPGMSNTKLITELHKGEKKLVVVVMCNSPEQGRTFIRAGADAFVSKSDPPEWVLEIVDKYESRFSKKSGEKLNPGQKAVERTIN